MPTYYNENDPFAAQWLRSLVREGLIAPGEVDERSIADVSAADLAGFGQHHFFAGIGGWSHALRLAGWPDDRPAWTGSCPCQPFSLAGRQDGFADPRHLWPAWHGLIRQCRPAVVFGEQVASAAAWLRLVRGDLEAMGYAVGAIPLQAASAGAYHLRDRYWFVADASGGGFGTAQARSDLVEAEPGIAEHRGTGVLCDMADADRALGQVDQDAGGRADRGSARPVGGPDGAGNGDMAHAIGERGRCRDDQRQHAEHADPPGQAFIAGADGKWRPVEPGIRLLAHGVPGRVGKLRGFGNAIDPRPAAAFIRAFAGG